MKTRTCGFLAAIIAAFLCLMFVRQAGADYPSEVLADGPLLYLRFEDSNMTHNAPVADLGSVGRGGTYIARGTSSMHPTAGAPGTGQAAYMPQTSTSGGNGNCVDIWDGDLVFALPDVTYEAWIKIAPDDLAYYSEIFQHNCDVLEMGGPGVMMAVQQYGVFGGDSIDYLDAPTDDGVWHHVVVTYESGASVLKELYVDGVSVGTAIGPNDLAYRFDRITIGVEGSRWYMWNHLKGAVDEFAIYESVIDADRVEAHYLAGIPEPTTLALLGLGGLALIRIRKV